MLQNNLYKITGFQSTETGLTATIGINAAHGIFEGHFPGNPILPGVCTVQIIKELAEHKLGRPTRLVRASNIKYLGFISPVAMPVVQFILRLEFPGDNTINCSASVSSGETALCSFKGMFEG
jgi:3-hydroxyacyl-[acyl-carrier-protein] dehydratase